jgi:hypothetical protein
MNSRLKHFQNRRLGKHSINSLTGIAQNKTMLNEKIIIIELQLKSRIRNCYSHSIQQQLNKEQIGVMKRIAKYGFFGNVT